MAKYNIGGYIFEDENKARKAAKELKAVEYILGQLKDSDEKAVLTVYKKLLNQRLFSTEIGMGFLSQLRKNLLDSGVFSEEEIPEIYSLDEPKTESVKSTPIQIETEVENVSEKPKTKKEKADKKVVAKSKDDSYEIKKLKAINGVLLTLCIALLLCVLGMFYVNSTINSPTILDYEEKIIDKYSTWEQELTEREEAVKEKELETQ